MMFKKWRITGLNRIKRAVAALLAVALLAGLPVFAAAEEEKEYSIEFSGFEIDFDVDTDYYLSQPADFSNCKIIDYTGFQSIAVSVEQYATYYPYKNMEYRMGDPLKLGNGRAKITIDATLQDGTVKEYLIAVTDPNAEDYAYARARVTGTVNMRAEPNTSSAILATFVNNARVYYLKSEGDWCMVEQLYTGMVGYIHRDYLRWEWKETSMPFQYRSAIKALQAAHPNWRFTYVDVEMTYEEALKKYGASNEQYIDPLNYLAEDKIFAMLDIDTYDASGYDDAGIAAIWANESAISKADAVSYFNAASKSLLMNPYYVTCRAALESGYGTSKFAKGTITGYEGYYNFFGIQCYDSDPTKGAVYAKERNWNSVFRSIVEGANWVKDQYLDQGAITPYFFRYAGFQNKVYMSDVQAPLKEASILKKAYTDPNAKAHFIIPVYREYPQDHEIKVTGTVGEETYTAKKESGGSMILKLPAETKSTVLQAEYALPDGVTLTGGSIKFYADPSKKIPITAAVQLSQKITAVYADCTAASYSYLSDGKTITVELPADSFVLRIESDRSPVEYTDAASFDKHWVKPYVDTLNNGKYGIFMGNAEGNLKIEDKITRYEIATIATRVLGLDAHYFNETNTPLNYGDTIAEWAAPYVRAVAAAGIMNGHSAGEKTIFDGNSFATREQVTKVLVTVCAINAGSVASFDESGNMTADPAVAHYTQKKTTVDKEFKNYTFKDTARLSEWAVPYMKLAVAEFKMIGGSVGLDGNLYLYPERDITRAEVAKMVAVYYES